MVKSNFERRPKDSYSTEPWVTETLIRILIEEGLDNFNEVWEPACGEGFMVRVLEKEFNVLGTDIVKDNDFFKTYVKPIGIQAIITNPPYNVAEQFINHALSFDVELVAMLLRNEYDCAKSRNYLFTEEIHGKKFALKIVLTSRPRWDNFVEKDKPDKSPRHNFSWFVFLKDYKKLPVIRYAKKAT